MSKNIMAEEISAEEVMVAEATGEDTATAVSESVIDVVGEQEFSAHESFPLAGGVGEIDLNIRTGELVTEIGSILTNNSVMGVPISHVHRESISDNTYGKGFRYNLSETFVKNTDETIEADYIYTDNRGEKYAFKEYLYGYDYNSKKQYDGKPKNLISVNRDGKLVYEEIEGTETVVYPEYRSATGMIARTELSGFKNIEYLEQRQQEYKDVEDRVKSFATFVENYCIVNQATGQKIYSIDNFSSNMEIFTGFITEAEEDGKLVLTKSEARAYKSYVIQKEKIALEKADYESKGKDGSVYLYQANIDNCEARIDQLDEELQNMVGKQEEYLSQLKDQYKEYYNLETQRRHMAFHMPVSFLITDGITKGFNENGNLVVIYGNGEEYVGIEYENACEDTENARIARLVDKDENCVKFVYNGRDELVEIVDIYGGITKFEYGTWQELKSIEYPNGKIVDIEYDEEWNIVKVKCDTDGEFTTITRETDKVTVETFFKPSSFDYTSTQNWSDGNEKSLGRKTLEYVRDDNLTLKWIDVSQTADSKTIQERRFYDDKWMVVESIVDEYGRVVKAEKYEYVPYWNGRQKNNNPHSTKSVCQEEYLYTRDMNTFCSEEYKSSLEYDTITVTYNEHEKPVREETSYVLRETSPSSVYRKEEKTYEYNEEQKVLKETVKVYTKIVYSDTNENETVEERVKTYEYNQNGKVVKTSTYTLGQELVDGIRIEERVYDKNGNELKTISYNTLAPADKFYQERVYDEKMRTAEEYDESGEHKTKYVYDEKSKQTQKICPNDSKLGFTYDKDGNSVSVMQSTEDGLENSNSVFYKYGKPTRYVSGNNVIDYKYSSGKKLQKVVINDQEVYHVDNTYNTTHNGETVDRVDEAFPNGDETTIYLDKWGKVLEKSYNGTTLVKNTYSKSGLLNKVEDGITSVTENISYNTRTGNKTYFTRGDYTESYTYDKKDRVTKLQTNGTTSYNYTYSGEKLSRISIANTMDDDTTKTLVVSPKVDPNGRAVGRSVMLGDTEISADRITYKKVGDHATILPASICYKGLLSKYSFIPQYGYDDRINYTYDSMGNITEVRENGKLVNRYHYDGLNRLIREDNKAFSKTYTYEYDNNGNRLSKREYEYTLCSMEDLKELEETATETYVYDGDKLLYCDKTNGGLETFTYDSMGMPTTYRMQTSRTRDHLTSIMSVMSSYDGRGRMKSLTTSSYVTFTYDSQGRIIEQSNGLKFLYDNAGVTGVIYDGVVYTYRKDILGNVIALLDESGAVVVRYVYDAWGNHKVYASDGTILSDYSHIGHLNPYRYRSYYYTSANLYWLKTRFYDASTGRFVSPDNLSYLAPDTVNGLNLYAYCLNNPVMFTDETGYMPKWLENTLKIGAAVLLTAILVAGSILAPGFASLIFTGAALGATGGLLAGGISSGMSSLISGGSFIDGFADGALSGSITGAISGAIAASPLGRWGQTGVNALISGVSYLVNNYNNFNLDDFLFNVTLGGLAGFLGGDGWTKAGSALAYDLIFNGIEGSFMLLGRGALMEFAIPIVKASIVGSVGFIKDIINKFR